MRLQDADSTGKDDSIPYTTLKLELGLVERIVIVA
jgi:hypothetical protein